MKIVIYKINTITVLLIESDVLVDINIIIK